jgi:hypothetical protein
VIDSTKVDEVVLASLELMLYGSAGADPQLPLPGTVIALFAGTIVEAIPTKPTNVANAVTIPVVPGVVYRIAGVPRTGVVNITEDTIVTATPADGYVFPAVTDTDWLYEFA